MKRITVLFLLLLSVCLFAQKPSALDTVTDNLGYSFIEVMTIDDGYLYCADTESPGRYPYLPAVGERPESQFKITFPYGVGSLQSTFNDNSSTLKALDNALLPALV